MGCGFGEATVPDSSKDRWGQVEEEATLPVAAPTRLFILCPAVLRPGFLRESIRIAEVNLTCCQVDFF